MIQSLAYQSVTLAGLQTLQVNVTGSVLSCLTTTANLKISIDGGPFIPIQGGIQIDNRPNLFTSIILQNPTTVAQTMTFYCGTCAVTYSPVTVDVDSTDWQTYTKGSGVLVAVASKNFPGYDATNNYAQRRTIVITNLDTLQPISLQDGAGIAFAQIPAGQAWTADTDGSITVINTNLVNYVVGEIFYAP